MRFKDLFRHCVLDRLSCFFQIFEFSLTTLLTIKTILNEKLSALCTMVKNYIFKKNLVTELKESVCLPTSKPKKT